MADAILSELSELQALRKEFVWRLMGLEAQAMKAGDMEVFRQCQALRHILSRESK